MKQLCVTVLVLCLLYFSAIDGVKIYLNGDYLDTIRATGLRLKDKDIYITGRLIRGDPFSGCSSFHNKDYIKELSKNQTVFVLTSTLSEGIINCGLEDRLRHVKDTGAVAMVYSSEEYAAGYGIGAYAVNAEKAVQDVDIIGLDMIDSSKLDDYLKDENNNVTAVLYDDPNLWWENRKGFTAITVLLEIANFGILGLCLLRLSQFIRKYGPQPSIPQICLWLEAVGSIMRILYFVDPSFCRGIWNLSFAAFLNFTHPCWSLSAALLLTFYWEEVMQAAHIQAFPKLAKMKIPALICITVLFILSIMCSIIRSQHVNVETATVNTVIQLVYTTPVAVFFCYGAVRILRQLYGTKSISKSSENLRRVTIMVAGIAASFFIIIFFLILFVSLPFSIQWFMANRFISWIAKTTEALCLVLSFQNPFEASLSSQSPQGSNRDTTTGSKFQRGQSGVGTEIEFSGV